MRIAILYNEPWLPEHDTDHAAEAGVLESVEALERSLAGRGHQVERVGLGPGALDTLARLADDGRPDVVVNLCEAVRGRSEGEAWVAGLLELAGLPYTGSDPGCLARVRDKVQTKALLGWWGLATPPAIPPGGTDAAPPRTTTGERTEEPGGVSLTGSEDGAARRTSKARSPAADPWADGPWIVKPACEDASQGLDQESVVEDPEALARQVARMSARYGPVLVERFVRGREFNLAVIALPGPRVLPLAEIEFVPDPGIRWPMVSYESKWVPGSAGYRTTPVRCPAVVDAELERRLVETALAAFRITGCRDYARVDVRVGSDGVPMILEVNANPDLSPDAGLARSLRVAGIPYEEFACDLVATAAARGSPDRWGEVRPVRGIPRGAGVPPGLLRVAGEPGRDPGHALGRPGEGVPVRPPRPEDLTRLLEIVVRCGNFRDDEVEVAREVIEVSLAEGPGGHYQTLVVEEEGQVIGWSAHGLVPATDATWDLYWIAVDPGRQGRGTGSRLLAEVERRVRDAGGRWVLAETSGTEAYAPTRGFYLRNAYREVGRVEDFYRPGDGRVTLGKRLRD